MNFYVFQLNCVKQNCLLCVSFHTTFFRYFRHVDNSAQYFTKCTRECFNWPMCYIWDRRVYFLKPSQNCARNTNKNNETSYFLFVLMPGPIHESPWALISKSTTKLPQLIVRRACSVRDQLPLGKELSQIAHKSTISTPNQNGQHWGRLHSYRGEGLWQIPLSPGSWIPLEESRHLFNPNNDHFKIR